MRTHVRRNVLLREYVRTILAEEGEYMGMSMEDAAQNPFGVSDFGSGNDLVDTFLKPWLNSVKTAAGVTKVAARSAAWRSCRC